MHFPMIEFSFVFRPTLIFFSLKLIAIILLFLFYSDLPFKGVRFLFKIFSFTQGIV